MPEMWIPISVTRIIILIFVTEAIVQAIFNACPVKVLKNFVIKYTSFLYCTHQGGYEEHLLSCKYCTSFWVGLCCAWLYPFLSNPYIFLLCLGLVLHRMSNFIHVLISYVRDKQLNLRVVR